MANVTQDGILLIAGDGLPADLIRGATVGKREIRAAIASGGRVAEIDFTGSQAVIEEEHWIIHRGAMFHLSGKIILPASGTVWLTGTTVGSIHWTGGIFNANEGGFEVEFRRGVVATGGTAATIHNRNDRSSNVTSFAVVQGATVSNEGVLRTTFGFTPAATQQSRLAVSGSDNREWILAENLGYGLKFFNLEAREKTIYVDFDFYEPGLLFT